MSTAMKLAPATRRDPWSRRGLSVSSRPTLHVVPSLPKRSSSWSMGIAVAVMLVVALLVPVVINTQMAMTSYQMHTAEQELSQLLDRQADLVTRAREAQSPQYLASKAAEIGLVPAGPQGYISLKTGQVQAPSTN